MGKSHCTSCYAEKSGIKKQTTVRVKAQLHKIMLFFLTKHCLRFHCY